MTMAMRVLVCLLAVELAPSVRLKPRVLSPLGARIAWAQGKLAAAEVYAEHEVATLAASLHTQEVKASVELGKKPDGSNSMKGSFSLTLDHSAPEPTPVNGTIPMQAEIVFKTDTAAQAQKLIENVEKMLEDLAGEGDSKELKETLPKINVDGNSIKVSGEHSMAYDEKAYDQIKKVIPFFGGISFTHDLYLDLDMWIKNPTKKLADVFFGGKNGVSATISKQMLDMVSEMFDNVTNDENQTKSLKDILGEHYDDVVENVKKFLKNQEATITLPGFDELKEKMEKEHKDERLNMTFNEIKQQAEELKKSPSVTGNSTYVAALNFVQQAAAANLRFSHVSLSMFSGAMNVAWSLDVGYFKTLATAATEAGIDKIVYGEKKPEEYGIPGVEPEQQIDKMKDLGKDESSAFSATCRSAVTVAAVALLGWTM